MKLRRAVLLLTLCLCLAGCGSVEEESQETDLFHYQTGSLSLDLTPPESWTEDAAVYGVHYDPLDLTVLETMLSQPVSREVADISVKENETDEPDGTAVKTILTGSEADKWIYLRNADVDEYVYASARYSDSAIYDAAGTELALEGPQAQKAQSTADAFLADCGIEGAVLAYGESLSETVCRLYYDPWGLEAPVLAYQMLTGAPGYIRVDVDEDGVSYAYFFRPSQITEAGEQESVLPPEQAAQALIDWYETEGENRTYAFNALELRYCAFSWETADSEDGRTGSARPCWVFYEIESDANGVTYEKSVAVDALTGEVCK